MKATIRFGEQRLIRRDVGAAHRLLFRIMGVADPAHYLHKLYFQRALDDLKDLSPTDVLDAGCGGGDYSFYLGRRYPGAEILGVDINDRQIERNRETACQLGICNVKFEVADLTTLDSLNRFDLVIAIDVLEHILRQQEALVRLCTALRPGGVAFFHLPTVRERPVPFSRLLRDFHAWAAEEHHATLCTAEEFVNGLRATGLEIVQAYRTFGYLTGELATSLFALPYADTTRNRLLQGVLALPCRVLALADRLNLERTRYAVAVVAKKPD